MGRVISTWQEREIGVPTTEGIESNTSLCSNDAISITGRLRHCVFNCSIKCREQHPLWQGSFICAALWGGCSFFYKRIFSKWRESRSADTGTVGKAALQTVSNAMCSPTLPWQAHLPRFHPGHIAITE